MNGGGNVSQSAPETSLEIWIPLMVGLHCASGLAFSGLLTTGSFGYTQVPAAAPQVATAQTTMLHAKTNLVLVE